MLTKEQKLILALRVNENKDVVFAKYGPGITKKLKENIWESIRQELVDMGANMPDVKALRDVEWYNLRRSCIKKYTDVQANGLPHDRLSELTNVVMDAIGWEQGLTPRDIQNQIPAEYEGGSPPPPPSYSPHPYLSPHAGLDPPRYPPQDHCKLKTKLLQLDIDLRRQQIRETKARTAYFQAATKLLNEKRSAMSSASSSSGPSQSQQHPISEFIVVDPSVLLD